MEPEERPAPAEPAPAELAPRPALRRPSVSRRLARGLERALACAGLFFLVYHGAFDCAEMTSGSMAPTLRGEAGRAENDWILYERLSVHVTPPPRFKLVVFRDDQGVLIAKRVVGQAGERVRIVDGEVEVDGTVRPLPEYAAGIRYLRAGNLRPGPGRELPFPVPEETLYVLGDDSKDSWDSRFRGPLPREQWKGRVVAVVWPPARWRWLW